MNETRPENCRNRLQEEGKSHPKSGCRVNGCGGVFNALCEKEVDYDLFLVGGFVRDEVMGLESNDMDYSVVINNRDDFKTALDAYYAFERDIKKKGFEVFLSSPDVFTIRSRFPDSKEVADFVIARKESGFKEGTRKPEIVELGTLLNDLARRDYSVNSFCKDMDGNIIDPFDGVRDIENKILRTPLSAEISFNDDPLRILRGVRFCVTKGFSFSEEVENGIRGFDVNRFKETVSTERIREELYKMFMHDTMLSLEYTEILGDLNAELYQYIFSECGIRLKPTMEK